MTADRPAAVERVRIVEVRMTAKGRQQDLAPGESRVGLTFNLAAKDETSPRGTATLEIVFESRLADITFKLQAQIRARQGAVAELAQEDQDYAAGRLYDHGRTAIAALVGHAGLPPLLLPSLSQLADSDDLSSEDDLEESDTEEEHDEEIQQNGSI